MMATVGWLFRALIIGRSGLAGATRLTRRAVVPRIRRLTFQHADDRQPSYLRRLTVSFMKSGLRVGIPFSEDLRRDVGILAAPTVGFSHATSVKLLTQQGPP
ncbi:hypothetical protein cyc_07438 [Cyclospora cayetanensis]|uniref:Uncharacterized protein n=1 Tax=Cyclospora cayetanensis TaxID=88456 RepID=A0A1D3DAC3_9EIME|nr:hypothetical protein cyc_07438 [Cyclospora cayetanensis]